MCDPAPATDEHGEPTPPKYASWVDRHMGGLLWVLILFCVGCACVGYWDTHDPARVARHERMREEGRQRSVDFLRRRALESLPPDATEVTVTRDDYPTGWLTFVRAEGDKKAKFLMCYRWDSYNAAFSMSVARAD